MAEKRYVMIFARFERFWHWSQAALVIVLLITGARLHGLFEGVSWPPAMTRPCLARAFGALRLGDFAAAVQSRRARSLTRITGRRM